MTEPDGSDAPPPTQDSQPTHAGPPNAAARRVVVGLAICFFVFAIVGDSFLPALVDTHPALFIALNARNRNLILAQPGLDWWTFFGIGAARLLVSDPLFFLLGRWYGDAGVRWIERRSPTYGPIARSAERFFGKASYPLVVIAPNNYVCMFAGAGDMAIPVFIVLNVAGTIGRLVLIWLFADWVEKPLDWILELISENRVPFLVLSITLVALTLFFDRRAGGTEMGGLLHIEDEVAEIEKEGAEPQPSGGAERDSSDEPPSP